MWLWTVVLFATTSSGFLPHSETHLIALRTRPLKLGVDALADCGRALEEAGSEKGWVGNAGEDVSAAGAKLLAASDQTLIEEWSELSDGLYAASILLAKGGLEEAAAALREASEATGCLSIGPPAAAPSLELAGREIVVAAKMMGYTAAAARLQEAGEAMVEWSEECGY